MPRTRLTLSMLILVYAVNHMDRQVVVILQEPIKRDLMLADWQLGLLTGFAFAVFYCVLGVPIARLADLGNRRNIIAGALALWSFMTAVCGAVTTYWQLLLARIGVGIGEAGCAPPSHSMISDLYPEGRRATALGVYNLGVYLGVAMGFLSGGWLNEFWGWRWAFVVVGAPGLLLALVFRLLVTEPRRSVVTSTSSNHQTLPMAGVLGFLWKNNSFRNLALATGLHAFAAIGVGSWLPSFFIRSHGLGTGEVASWLAPITSLAGAAGAILGGYLCDRLEKHDVRWNIGVPALAILVSVPFSVAVYMLGNYKMAFLLSVFPTLLGAMYFAPLISISHRLVGSQMRAVTSSVLLLVANLVGMGLGPWLTGLLSDTLHPILATESLRWALTIVVLVNVWSVLHYYQAARTLQQDLAQAPG